MSIASVELEHLITSAMRKVDGKKENAICHFLPGPTGGYMHHFTLRKMKKEEQNTLATMIRRFIIDIEKPSTIKPKQRAARGSRKKKGQVILSDADAERILTHVRAAGDREMARKLLPRKELKVIKRELINSIRGGEINNDLWNTYVEYVESLR